MSVGYTINKGDIDQMLGSVAVNTRDILSHGQIVLACLGGLTDTQLQNIGYTTADVTLIRAVAVDIQTLEQVITGQAAVPTAKDFTTNLKQLYGAN